MGQQGISAVQDVSDGIDLMGTEGDFWVHSGESQVAAVIFSGADGVELFVVELSQPFTAGRVVPDPVCKGLLDQFLLALGNGGFLLVQNRNSFSGFIFQIIEDTNIFQIQSFLNDLVGIDSACTIGVVSLDANPVNGFALDIPLAGVLGIR